MEKIRRLKQVSTTLYIDTSTIVDYLAAKGFHIENKPTAKITQEQYDLLATKFAASIEDKKRLASQSSPSKANESKVHSVSNLPTNEDFWSQFENSIFNRVPNNTIQHSKAEPNSRPRSSRAYTVSSEKREFDQRAIWDKYIQAQEKILDYQAMPIAIRQEYELSPSGKLKLEVDQNIFKDAFAADIKSIFKLKDADFSYEQGYIVQSVEVTKSIPVEKLVKLRDDAKKFYIDLNENPVIEGEITTKKHPLSAVVQVEPSLSYFISQYYKNSDIYTSFDSDKIVVKNGELHQEIISKLRKELDLKLNSYKLEFHIVADHDVTTDIAINGKHKLYFSKHQGSPASSITLPIPSNNTFSFYFDVPEDDEEFDINLKYNYLLKILKRFYSAYKITSEYKTFYIYDKTLIDSCIKNLSWNDEQFWNELYSTLNGSEYHVSPASNTVSFEYESAEQLSYKLKRIKAIKHIYVQDIEETDHLEYKNDLKTDLLELVKTLKQAIPSLTTRVIADGTKLQFRYFYKSGGRQVALALLHNSLESEINTQKYSLYIDNLFKEKYICEENFELKKEEESEKLLKLRGREFYIGDKKNKIFIGTLKKVNYPKLAFNVEEVDLEELSAKLDQKNIKAIIPDLKGDRDKVARLRETMVKLHSKEKLPNDNVKNFLFDSSKAEPIEDIDFILNKNSEVWQEFESHIYSKTLNDSQKEAVLKAVKGKELVLIQGPPGTGKSTAIAEIIWQHVRVNQKERILLTSETNLAVDNAIDRLKNSSHNLVKPVRFGNDEKLESEGLFYSLPEMDRWVNETTENNNAVSHWLNNIARRVEPSSNPTVSAPLTKWQRHLTSPSKETRSLFKTTYVSYANVIGATGSSIGFKNSEGNWTSFYRSYLQVVAGENFAEKAKKNQFNISFDTVVMDEASKATPSELALPLVYAKKSIIVGDHRQLPPLLDGEEIKEKLISIGEQKLAQTLSRKEFEISQFERLFSNIDSSIKGTFNTQYRMHPAINEVIKQFYIQDGGLRCGLPLLEEQHNNFDNPTSRFHGLSNDYFIEPHVHTIWVDVQEPEMLEGTSRINYGEVEAVKRVLDYLQNSEGFNEFKEWLKPQSIEEQQIGLVSFYGKQIKLLDQIAKEYSDRLPVRVSTVDRFQGMERNIIIVSMVRSNLIATTKDQQPNYEIYPQLGYPKQESLGFAESPNRLNVALSRARRLLIIVGNSQHFCKKQIYRNVYDAIKDSDNGRIVDYKQLSKYLSA